VIEVYRYVRNVRREHDFLSAPTKREETLIFRALELAPDSPTVLRNLGIFYQDALKGYLSRRNGDCTVVQEMGVANLVREMISRAK